MSNKLNKWKFASIVFCGNLIETEFWLVPFHLAHWHSKAYSSSIHCIFAYIYSCAVSINLTLHSKESNMKWIEIPSVSIAFPECFNIPTNIRRYHQLISIRKLTETKKKTKFMDSSVTPNSTTTYDTNNLL